MYVVVFSKHNVSDHKCQWAFQASWHSVPCLPLLQRLSRWFVIPYSRNPSNARKSQGSSVAVQAKALLARGAGAWCEGQRLSELKSHWAMGRGLPGVCWRGDTFHQCKLCLCLPAVAEKEYLWKHLGRAEEQAKQWPGTSRPLKLVNSLLNSWISSCAAVLFS